MAGASALLLCFSWGGRKIGTASNIVFSNGLLDPWHGFGVLEDVSATVVAVVIPEGAHHLDVSNQTLLLVEAWRYAIVWLQPRMVNPG